MAKLREQLPDTAELLAPEGLANFHLGDWGRPDEGLTVLRQRFFAARDAWSAEHGVDIDALRVVGRGGAATAA